MPRRGKICWPAMPSATSVRAVADSRRQGGRYGARYKIQARRALDQRGPRAHQWPQNDPSLQGNSVSTQARLAAWLPILFLSATVTARADTQAAAAATA